uniref:SFRICE_038801 n=1 Tax=Spodoptera frugiperda TaxID=7108 RepID=A0A2H1VT96_SPOFR
MNDDIDCKFGVVTRSPVNEQTDYGKQSPSPIDTRNTRGYTTSRKKKQITITSLNIEQDSEMP